jgi:hypothetical protein
MSAKEAAAPSEEPVAFITEKLDGSRRSIMLASKYDPRKAEFWVSDAVRQGYRIIPLFPPPAVAPVAWQLLLEERDKFIVGKGLWSEFVATIPLSAQDTGAAAKGEEPVAQLGGAPDDLHNLIKVVFADMTIERMGEVCKEVIARRTAPYAPPAVAPVAVSVKGLEWRANPLMNWVAPSIVGQYFVFKDAGDSTWAMAVPDAVAAGEFKTADLAKAAAQSDFNARILSATDLKA